MNFGTLLLCSLFSIVLIVKKDYNISNLIKFYVKNLGKLKEE